MKTRIIDGLLILISSILIVNCSSVSEKSISPTEVLATEVVMITPTLEETFDPTVIPQATIGKEVSVSVISGTGPVNVRACPNTSCEKVGMIEEGEIYPTVGRSEDSTWVLITLPDGDVKQGWVNSNLIQFISGSSLADLPAKDDASSASDEQDITVLKNYLASDDLMIETIGSGQNLNFPSQEVNRYRIDGVEYDLDKIHHRIVWIDTANSLLPKENGKVYTKDELQQKAQLLITQLLPVSDLTNFSLTQNLKEENYFFRWQAADGTFIQVGYDTYGNLLNYCNATGN
jgi:hypothetical protein